MLPNSVVGTDEENASASVPHGFTKDPKMGSSMVINVPQREALVPVVAPELTVLLNNNCKDKGIKAMNIPTEEVVLSGDM